MNNSTSDHKSDSGHEQGGSGGVVKLPGVTIPVPRTFRALDRLLARPLEHLEEYLDKKRAENISAHAKAVDDANPTMPKGDPSVQQIELLAKWAENASSFSEEDKELAAAWRAALERIKAGDPYSSKIIHALSTLSAADIVAFLNSIPKHLLDALEKNELAFERSLSRHFIRLDVTAMAQTTIHELDACGLIFFKRFSVIIPAMRKYVFLFGICSTFYLLAYANAEHLLNAFTESSIRSFTLINVSYAFVVGLIAAASLAELTGLYPGMHFISPIGISFIKSFYKYYKQEDNKYNNNSNSTIKRNKKKDESRKV
jgi:hypothetical protein